MQTAIAIHFHFFLLARVQDLQNVLRDWVFVLLAAARLQQDFYIAQLPEVEVTFFFERAVLQLQLIYLLYQEAAVAAADSPGGCCFFDGLRRPSIIGCLRAGGGASLVARLNGGASALGPSHFVATGDVEEVLALAAAGPIVGLAIIVLVEEGLHPLAEL